MKILITGTSGFVGGALGRYARGLGHEIIGLSRRPARLEATDRHLSHDLRTSLEWDTPIDAVIHAAALSSPWGRPAEFEAANVDGTRHALEIARASGAHFILISSSSVLYARGGDQLDLPETPAPDIPAANDYARTKRIAERLVSDSGLDWAILRPRAVFGVGDTVLFPRIARAARLRLLPRFARDRPAIGDLVSIDNLVRLTLAAAEHRATGIFHLIDPAPVSITDFVAEALSQVALPGPTFTLQPAAAHRIAGLLETLSRRTGWWEPPLTHFGVDVFATSKTFDASRTLATLGPSLIPTKLALARFAQWWRAGAALDDPAMGRVGAGP